MRTRFISLCMAAALAGLSTFACSTADAQDAELLNRYGDWDVYTRGDGASRFCFMVSKPKEASLRSRRGEIFFLVWHRPAQKEFDVVQVDIGYPFKQGSEAEVAIGGNTWQLFTRDESAWTYKSADDAVIVAALRKGSRMSVKGVSGRGNPTTDTYSLKGTSAAHRAINKACGR